MSNPLNRSSFVERKINGWYVTETMPGTHAVSRGPYASRYDAYRAKAEVDHIFQQKLALYEQALIPRHSLKWEPIRKDPLWDMVYHIAEQTQEGLQGSQS